MDLKTKLLPKKVVDFRLGKIILDARGITQEYSETLFKTAFPNQFTPSVFYLYYEGCKDFKRVNFHSWKGFNVVLDGDDRKIVNWIDFFEK